MFKKIVWATDGSDSAEKALPYAKSLAEGQDATLFVAHAVETYTGSRAAGLPLYANEEELQEKVKSEIAELESEGVRVESKFLTGLGTRAAHAIAEYAREVGADVIVAGTRGHTPLGGLLLGSVTQRLLHIAPCPVLVVPAELSAPAGEGAAAETAAA